MSAMSLILLCSWSRLITELSFIAKSTCVFGSKTFVPKRLVVVPSFSVKTSERRGSSMGTNPSNGLIFGCMWSTTGSTKRLKIWYCGILAASAGVSSFLVSMLKSLTSLKLTDVNPMFSICLIAAQNSDFFSCCSVQFLSMWKPMSMSLDPMYFLPVVFSKFRFTM